MAFIAGAGRTRIELRSLWFLLVYASDQLEKLALPDREKILSGERDNDLLDAVGEILARDIEKRLRTMLAPQYMPKVAVLTRLRGRIDHLGTARRRLMESGRALCHFDVQSIDLPRYRYMLVTLRQLALYAANQSTRSRCSEVAIALERRGIHPIDPTITELTVEQFGRHDTVDKNILRLCRLVRNMALPEHSDGDIDLPVLRNDENAQHTLRRLFEAAIRNFYRWHLSHLGFSVRSRSRRWSEEMPSGDDSYLPSLNVDALISSSERQLVLECKFGPIFDSRRVAPSNNTSTNWMVKADYIRQIFAYCEAFGRDGIPTEGLIIAARVENSPGKNLNLKLGKWPVRIREVDLSASPSSIRSDLLEAIAYQ